MNALKPLRSGESPYRGKQVDPTRFVRFGCISRVDYETGYVDIQWIDGQGSAPLVSIPLTHSSLRSSIRGMPEKGSVVICGWSRQSQTWEEPVILGYADIGLETLLEYRLIRSEKTPDALKEIKTIREKIGYNVIRGKRRKIYPGEIQVESSPGAELYLDENVYLSDSKLNEIEICSFDKSIRFSANQLYTLTQASRTWNGMVAREPGNLDFVFQPTTLPNGQKIQFVTDSNNSLHVGGRAFTEHRTELYQLADGITRATEVNAGYDVNALPPYLTFVMGTLVGNDKTDTAKYAKILRPQVFGVPTATEVALDYLECAPEEYTTLASTLHFRHQSRAQFDIDKEGHLFTFFPASSGRHPLGPGRSWEAGFEGSVKLAIGAENIDNRSLFLDTKGSVKASLGYDKEGKSFILIAQKSIHLEAISPDNEGTAFYLKTKGLSKTVIDGNCDLLVTGNYNITVRGKLKIESTATGEDSFVNDKNIMYGGSYKKITVKDQQDQIGYNRIAKITGNLERSPGIFSPALGTETTDQMELTTGSRDEKYWNGNLRRVLLLGNMEASLTSGDIKESITLGNRLLTIVTGSQKDKITTGNDETEVITGSIKETITTGNRELTITTGSQKDKIVTGNNELTVTTGSIKETISTGNRELTITTGSQKDKIVTGNDETKITTGSDKELITTGSKELKITTGSIKETVSTGNRELKITTGSQKETITTGNKETKVTTGNIKENITTGNKETKVTTGNIKENIKTGSSSEAIVTGSKKITIKAGGFTVDITAGNIDIKTKAGKVKLNSTSQTVDISGLLTVTVKSGVKLNLTAPQVAIGQLPTKGGVVCGLPGMFTHLDYVTGAPLLGSKTVKASI